MKAFPYFLLLILSACTDSPKERTNGYSTSLKSKEDSLYHEVMESHDAAMAKIGKLRALKNAADKKIDSLSKSGEGLKKKATLVTLRKKLEQADDSMNQWMERFNLDSAQNNSPRRLPYLQNEKEKVLKVRDLLLQTVAEADSILKK